MISSFRLKLEISILIGLLPILLLFYLSLTSGVIFFVILAVILTSILLFLKSLKWFFPLIKRMKSFLNRILLVTASVMMTIILIESFLWAYQLKPQGTQQIVMPNEWKRRVANIPGASYAYYWHNILHVHDKNSMRRTTPFPPKEKNNFRIMVVGDSLTYGYGVREEETYPRSRLRIH